MIASASDETYFGQLEGRGRGKPSASFRLKEGTAKVPNCGGIFPSINEVVGSKTPGL